MLSSISITREGKIVTKVPNWRTSTYTQHENCVEVADNDIAEVKVRDSKRRSIGLMAVSPTAWAQFVEFSKAVTL